MICHNTSKIEKNERYRSNDDDVIKLQTSLKMHTQLYSTSTVAFCSKTWSAADDD